MQHDRTITISAGNSRKAVHWQPQTLRLSELYERLRVPARSAETLEEYLRLPKKMQDDRKDVGGFVAGTFSGPRRKANNVTGRDVLTLDLDNIPAGGTSDVLRRVEGLGCGYCIYSTRKHMPAAPRLRVLLPLDRTVTADEYEPVARKMAEYIGITLADPTTFEPARLMYWPSCSKDSEYIYTYQDKPMLSADGLLRTYVDWRDFTSWPQVSGAQSPSRLATKQGDPLTKPGIVGAFCRAYSVEEAMDKFIPEAYEEAAGAPDRYTYTGGSTTGGAVVYDNGKFLFSHHATDPCGGKLVNAFDLVRLHRFEGMDDEAEPGTPVNRLPSYKAMQELAVADPKAAQLLLEDRWEKTQAAFDPAPGVEEAPDDGAWLRPPIMDVDGQLRPLKTLKNYKAALVHCPKLAGRIRLNQFSGRISVDGELPWARPGNPRDWTDSDTVNLRIFLEPHMGKISKDDAVSAIKSCAGEQAFHPVREYLLGLSWDGTARLDNLLIDYLGAGDTQYTRAVTRKAIVAAVARVMRPGCKYDTMLVLIGSQGRHKSTLLAIMGGEWFSASLRTFDRKEAMETIQGTWINEVAEMQAMAKSEVDAVKAFISNTSDYYRASYGQFAEDHPRQCVFFGTTNSRECLTDRTGGRRFWTVDIDQQERRKDVFQDLLSERDQIWAEAVAMWQAGEPLHLPVDLEQVARIEQEEHRQAHPWEGLIQDFLEQPVPEDWSTWDENQRSMFYAGSAQGDLKLIPRDRVCALEVWCEALGKKRGELIKSMAREINEILESMPGWTRIGAAKAGKPYGTQRCFTRTGAVNLAERGNKL